ncbi:PP2C family protein-serine/threonine phosphatase [Microbacterium telephonicum]|uniref:Protein phosphatase n=1 Tax=Microbacterium telephonicum TaxID=1714841 RepID=A0A498CCQ1_9MICO|nr:protein phosphatase 2C domain-containing protein [Microbacterium telephonicum]RLK52376.1 protein phosphatase [Microbacterium telephonicum]
MTGAPIVVAVGAASHTGLRRRVNEDSYLAEAPLFLVADGMGGHEAGDRASAAVVAEFAALAGRDSLDVDEVRRALRRARDRVATIGGAGRAAGTTLSGVVVADVDGAGYWLTVNVGDSRTYRLSRGMLEQISVDHSVVQELVDAGLLAAAAAASDSRRNEITRAIGAGSDGKADYSLVPAEPGDRILVCSDGLSGELSAARLRVVLAEESDPQAAATRLIHEALVSGGRDNITAVVVDALHVAGQDDLYDTAPAGARRAPDEDTRPRAGAGGDQR